MKFRAHLQALACWVSVLLSLLAFPAAAEQWVRVGPGPDAYVRGIRLFTNTPAAGQSTIFASTLGAGVVKLVDNGTSITATQLNTGLPNLRVRAVAATDVNTLFAVVDAHGFYKSLDGGATWNAFHGSGGTKLGCTSLRNISVRTATEIWALGGCQRDSGLWRTLDGGLTWARIGVGVLPDDVAINSVTFSGTGPTTIAMVASSRDGLFRSIDNGATWVQTNNGLPAPAGANLVSTFNVSFLASGAEMLVYVEGHGIYRSTNSGGTWTASNTGLPAHIGSHGGISRANATTFFIGVDNGPIYRTTDGGLNWSAFASTGTNEQTRFARGITFDASSPGRTWVHGTNGLARSADNGATFTTVPMPEGYITSTGLAPNLVTGYMSASSLFKVPDVYAADWTAATDIGAGIPGFVDSVVADPNTAGVLYAAVPSRGTFVKSATDGASWFEYPQAYEKGTTPGYEVSLGDANTLFGVFDNKFGTMAGGGFKKSTDGGATWVDMSTGLTTPEARQVNALTQTATAGVMLISTDAGIFRTTDGAATWSLVLSRTDSAVQPLPFGSLRVDPVAASTVWASATHVDPDGTVLPTSGIYKSTDTGTTWTQVLVGKRAGGVRPESSGRVLALLGRSLAEPAFVASIDGGATWQPFVNGLDTGDGLGLNRTRSYSDTYGILGMTASGVYALAKPLLTVAATGSGTVVSAVDGITCPGTCSAKFFDYQLVNLIPLPAVGQSFLGWGGACSGAGACNVRMDAVKSVTATFSTTPAMTPSATTVSFGGQSMNTTAPTQTVTFNNTSGAAVAITGVTVPTGFAIVSNNCATVAAGASCQVVVSFTPGTEGALAGNMVISYAGGPTQVALSGTGERSLVTHYYRSILGRAPDPDGKAYWEGEAARVAALGANVNETWYALATTFFVSPEYIAFNRSNTGFLTDLYNTFFNRAPDAGGLEYWNGLMAGGMPREVVLVGFMFSEEFKAFTRALFGNPTVRAEMNTVMDFYRGLLSRLPDGGGFGYWVGQFRTAQCTSPAAIYAQVEAISSAYANSPEYAARNRSHAQFVGDMYNAFMRRGGDLGGVNYWVGQLQSGARTRENVRQAFITTPEFSAQVQAIVNQGCKTN